MIFPSSWQTNRLVVSAEQATRPSSSTQAPPAKRSPYASLTADGPQQPWSGMMDEGMDLLAQSSLIGQS